MDDPLCPPPYGKQRYLLQWLGTDVGRKLDSYRWIKRLKKTLDEELPPVAVVADIRFPNEMLWVKANHGVMIRVERKGYTDGRTLLDPNYKPHSSETALDRLPEGLAFDYEIAVEDGNVDELKNDAAEVFRLIVETRSPHTVEVNNAPVLNSEGTQDALSDARAPEANTEVRGQA